MKLPQTGSLSWVKSKWAPASSATKHMQLFKNRKLLCMIRLKTSLSSMPSLPQVKTNHPRFHLLTTSYPSRCQRKKISSQTCLNSWKRMNQWSLFKRQPSRSSDKNYLTASAIRRCRKWVTSRKLSPWCKYNKFLCKFRKLTLCTRPWCRIITATLWCKPTRRCIHSSNRSLSKSSSLLLWTSFSSKLSSMNSKTIQRTQSHLCFKKSYNPLKRTRSLLCKNQIFCLTHNNFRCLKLPSRWVQCNSRSISSDSRMANKNFSFCPNRTTKFNSLNKSYPKCFTCRKPNSLCNNKCSNNVSIHHRARWFFSQACSKTSKCCSSNNCSKCTRTSSS